MNANPLAISKVTIPIKRPRNWEVFARYIHMQLYKMQKK